MKVARYILPLTSLAILASCQAPAADNSIKVSIAGNSQVEVGARIKLNVSIENDGQRRGYTLVSSDPSVASVDSEGYVTGLQEGETTITATSIADPEATADWDILVTASSIPTASISAFSDFCTVGGKIPLEAVINNPTSYEPIITWTTERSKGSILGARTADATFQSNVVGNEIVKLVVNIGPYTIKQEKQLYVADNYNDPAKAWIAIPDADTFMEYFLNGSSLGDGGVEGNYYLSEDIDLQGLVVTKSMNSKLLGTLDGRGHKITNFYLQGDGPDENGAYANAGLFDGVGASAAIRNLEIDVEMDSRASGWGSSALTNGADGVIENVLVNVNHSFNNGEFATEENGYYVPFNAGLVGVPGANSRYYDCVVNVTGDGYDTIYADCAYPSGTGSAQSFRFDGFYTNSVNVGGQTWDWGGPVTDFTGYTIGLDWAATSSSAYRTLSSRVWNLSDGAMPTLKVL